MRTRGTRDALHRRLEARIVEGARDAEEVGQVEVADPEHVDALGRGDRLAVLEAVLGLDLRDQQRAGAQPTDLVGDVATGVVVVREAEGRAAPAVRRIPRGLDHLPRLRGRLDHRHHHAGHTHVQRPRDVGVLAARHPHHRLDRQAPVGRDEPLQGLEPEPGVLHVVDREATARLREHRRDPGGEEFEDHRAGDRVAGEDGGPDGVVSHRVSSDAARRR